MKRNGFAVLILLLGAGALGALAWRQRVVEESSRLVGARISRDLRRHLMPADAPWRDRRTESLLRAFYEGRHQRPAWTSGGRATDQARQLADVLVHADRDGLDPEDYSATRLAARWEEHHGKPFISVDPKDLADFDLLCTLSALRYMSDVHDGRISPRSLDATWVAQPRRGDLDSLLDAAVRRNRVRPMLASLAPTEPGYVRLRDARARIAAAGAGAPVGQLQRIELNMERWRWLPRSLGNRYLLVDIPEYALHVMENGREVLGMRVVVGKVMSATPVFSDVMTQVVINPTWSIPVSIATREIAQSVMDDPGYLAKNHIRVFDRSSPDAAPVDSSRVDWSDSNEVAKLSFRQDAGEDNALGRIKFLLPNRFDVYLHDTPAGHLFSARDRSFSHGCVRVEDPMALAEYVLRGSKDGSRADIQRLIDAGKTVTLKVPDPLPVHIVYFTAYADERGQVAFRDDVYGIDADQMLELRSHGRSLGAVSRRE